MLFQPMHRIGHLGNNYFYCDETYASNQGVPKVCYFILITTSRCVAASVRSVDVYKAQLWQYVVLLYLKLQCLGYFEPVYTKLDCEMYTFSGERTDVSLKTKTLTVSVAFSAGISLKSPRKLFIFMIRKYIYRIKVSKIIII